MKNNSKGLSFLFEDKGFYIILFLCLIAIGISGYVLFFTDTSETVPEVPPQVISSTTQDEITTYPNIEDVDIETVEETPESVETVVPEPIKMSDENTDAGADAPAIAPEIPVSVIFVPPVPGETAKVFSSDELIYDVTMDDWRVHVGTDFLANEGDRVYAITDGTVEDVYENELWGFCVVLSHADNLKTIYRGLHEDLAIEIDDTVKAGDILGALGPVSPAENMQGSHLHVEALRDGEYIDVLSLLN